MRRRALVSALLTLAGAGSAGAAPPPIAQHTCPNGLEVLVVENHALPLMTVEIAARNGSMTESPEYNGLSHLYEHMFFKANSVLPSQEAFLARMRELGMQFNGTTNTERVNYFFTTTSDHFADAMAFMRDAIVSPKFDEKELSREREVVVGEIDRNESNPYYHFNHTIEQHVWWKYPSYKDPLGNRTTVRAATQQMMQTIQHRYYVPNNSVLVLTGDVKADEVFKLADQLYTAWPRAEDPFIKYPLVQHPPIQKSEVVVVAHPAVQTFNGMIVWHGPSTVGGSVPDTYPADVLGVALGDPSSKFQKALIDSGACVGAGLSWYTQKNVGPITLGFEAAPDKVDACVQAALAELPKIKAADYFTDEELDNAKHQLEVLQIKEREKPSSLAHTLTFWWASAGLDYYLNYVANVKKVARPDIAKFMDDFVLGKPFVFGALVSPPMEKAGVNQAHLEQLAGLHAGGMQQRVEGGGAPPPPAAPAAGKQPRAGEPAAGKQPRATESGKQPGKQPRKGGK